MTELTGDRFEILSLAGQGGMGKVFRARDVRDDAIVALKVLRYDGAPDAVMRFRRETDALSRLEHPAIVRYVARGTTDGRIPFLAMEWVEGEELRVRLKRAGPLPAADLVILAARIAGALAHAHERNIVHRDVKPSNIILPEGRVERAMLIDFGLARIGLAVDDMGSDDQLTETGMLVGTPAYMAPEQIRDEEVTPSMDVFALGAVMYQCLAGVAPFAAGSATAILARVLFGDPAPLAVRGVPPGLADLIGAMLRKAPGERPSMRAVLRDLSDLPSAVQGVTPRLSTAEQRVVAVIVAGAGTPSGGDEDSTLRDRPEGVLDFEALGAIAHRFDAEITRLPTGAVIAVLGSQGAATDLATRAAECSLALKQALPTTPIGLAIGRAQTDGGIAIGEAIDRAVGLTPFFGESVRVDDVSAGLIGARFGLQSTPEGTLLDRRASIAVRTLLGKPTPCVGRDAELAMLQGIVLQSANESVARVVLVTAPPGAGKSRIQTELAARLSPTAVWIGHGDSIGAGTPFGMLGQIVRREARIADGQPVEESQRKLLERTGDPQIAMFLGEMIGVRFEDGDIQLRAARSDPRLMADRMQQAFVDFIGAACASGPLVVLLEDLQWGDAPTIAAIDAALRAFEDRAFTVIAFARPEVNSMFPRLWAARGVQSLVLAPLPKKAAARLVRAVLGDPSDAVVGDLVDKAAGNVFLLEELVRAEAEGRGGEVPSTVVAIVQSRLGALDPDIRRVLRAASILGDTFTAQGVRALLGDDAGDAERRLEDLVRNEILARDGTSYAFRHGLVREGAYAMLTNEDRALGHRLAASWLERGDAPALVVAAHWEKAGDRDHASIAYLRAAEQALEASDLVRAIEHAERSAALGASGELLGALRSVQAHAHHWRGDTEKMESAAARAVALLPPSDLRYADALTLLAVAKQRLGHTEDLGSVADELSAMLDAGRDSTAGDRRASLARAGGRVASLLFFAGKQDRAAAMLDAAQRAAEGAGGADVMARIHQARAPHARQAGFPEKALRHAEVATHAFRTAGDLRNACMMEGIRGFALSELGAYADAEVALVRALATAERLGLTTVASSARSNLGIVFLRLQRHEEAEASVRAAIAAFESSDRRHEGGSRAYLAMILLERGALAEAETEARRALVLLEAALALRPVAGAVLASVLLASGRVAEALEVAREAVRASEGVNVEEGDALLRLAHARSLFAAGERTDARAVIAAARDRVVARAATIESRTLRASFLAVPAHRTTLDLADEWALGR